VDADALFVPVPDAPRRSPWPVVQALLDVIPLVRADAGMNAAKRRWARWAPRYRDAAAIVAISQHSADEGIRLLGLDTTRVHVSHLGVDPIFHPSPDTEPTAPYLVVVSEFSPRKGFDLAFATVAAIAAAGHPHRLHVAGRIAPWVKAEVEALRDRSARPDLVDLLGFVDNLPQLYRGASAFLGTSRYEGFGLPALEAMACGTPVVAFANSATTEVVGDGGVLVPDGDLDAFVAAVRRVLTDPGYADELRQRAIARASLFSWDRAAATHAEIIRSVTS
jgi:glycosyltransferase involved in cell wall biosynthesis